MTMKQSQQERINIMFQKLQLGDQQLDHSIQKAILIVGDTGAGKTTSSYILTNKQLIPEMRIGQTVYNYKQIYQKAEIGHKRNSCTQIPNTFKTQFGDLIDCPGFLDTYKFDRYLSNAYYIYRIFSNSVSLKFILTFSEAAFTTTKYKQLIETIKCFFDLFKFDQKFTPKVLVQSTALLITKTTSLEKSSVIQILQMLNQQPPQDLNQQIVNTFKEFLSGIINQQKIFFIPRAVVGIPLVKNNYLYQINKQTKFWTRPLDENNEISMQNVHFQIKEKNMKKDENLLATKAAFKCTQCLLTLSKGLSQGLQQIQQILFECGGRYKFFDNWEKIIHLYGQQIKMSNIQNIEKESNKYLSKIQLLKQIHMEISFIIGNNETDKLFEITKKTIFKILGLLIKYIKMDKNEENTLRQFYYLFQRKFEQIKVLLKLNKQYGKIGRQPLDFLVGFSTKNYEEIQKEFALKYIVKQNQSIQYYDQILQFLSNYKNQNQIIASMEKCYFNKGKYYQSNKQRIKALSNYISAIKYSQKYNQLKNSINYTHVNEHLFLRIANIFFEAKQFKQALEFYKVINHISKIKYCYDQLYLTTNHKLMNRIYKGDYLRNLALFEEAKLAYIQGLIDANETQKTIISERIIQIYDKQSEFKQKNKIKLQKKQFYNRLPKDYNLDQLISRLQTK